jgi:uncharacterized protein YcbK (DUF882 family)
LRSEIACPCCGALPPDDAFQKLLAYLEAVRERYGHPMPVTSGYRCPRHNAAVGGVATSPHLLGLAADVRVANGALRRRLVEAAIMSDTPGIGIYERHVHLDLVEREHDVMWWGEYGRQ